MNSTKTVALLLCALVCAACTAGPRPTQRVDQNSIAPEELRASGYHDAFALVQALRPHWLSTRGPDSFRQTTPVLVYLDGVRLGGVAELRGISTRSLQTIMFLDGIRASERYGLDHASGAIVASTTTNAARR